jgi:hypothetical protein
VGGDDPEFRRTITSGRRARRPMGGHAPFEKARVYVGAFAAITLTAVVAFSCWWYATQVRDVNEATGRSAGRGSIWQQQDEAKRKAYQERARRTRERAIAAAKAQAKSG